MSLFEPPEGHDNALLCDRTGCGHRCDEHDGLGCFEVFCCCPGFEAPVPDEDDRDAAEVKADREGIR